MISKAINKAIAEGVTFYAYRLPYGEPLFRAQHEGVSSESSHRFRIVPFDIQSSFSEVIINGDINAKDFLSYQCSIIKSYPQVPIASTERADYDICHSKCLDAISSGIVDKIVLSRTISYKKTDTNWGAYFLKLCDSYPSAFSFIFQSPQTGLWIGASPETLGSYHNSVFHTMALVGTRCKNDTTPWHDKEICEQRYVSKFIEDAFKAQNLSFSVSDLTTVEAGNVKHLCNFYQAKINSINIAEHLTYSLHPTPAISGIPQSSAIKTIKEIEPIQRSYYGGFIGPFDQEGFDYFVNLRSMQVFSKTITLFCGGGITSESIASSEWNETEAKSQTLLSIF